MKVIYKPTGQLGEIPDDKFDPSLFAILEAQTVDPEQNVRQETPSLQNRIGSGIISVGKSMISPFVKTAKNIAGAGYELYRGAKSLAGDKNAYYDDNGVVANPFLNEKEIDRAVNHTAEEVVRNSAGIASWAVPFGKGANIATKVLLPGAAVGALQTGSEEGTNAEDIVGGAAVGAAGAGVLHGATKVLGKIGSKLESSGNKIRVGEVNLPASLSGAGNEKAVQETLSKYGVKGTPQVRYEKLEPTVAKISQEIETHLSQNAKPSSIPEIKAIFLEKIKPSIRQGDITMDEASQAFDNYFSNNVVPVTPNFESTPSTLDIFNLKKDVQSSSSQVAKAMQKAENKKLLTPQDKIMITLRNSLDDLITKQHPEIKDLTMDQSRLYDAIKPVERQRRTVPTVRALGITIPKGPVNLAIDKSGSAIETAGKAMQLPKIVPEGITSNVGARLPLISSKQGIPDQQNELNNEQGNNDFNNHSDIVNPVPTTSQDRPTIEQHYLALEKAKMAGDTRAEKQIRENIADELAFQKAVKPAVGSVSKSIDMMESLYGAGTNKSLSAGKSTVGPMGLLSKANIVTKKGFDQEFSDRLNSYKTQMALVAGAINQAAGAGVLNGGEYERLAMKSFPNEYTSDAVAKEWFDNARKVLDSIPSDRGQSLQQLLLQTQ